MLHRRNSQTQDNVEAELKARSQRLADEKARKAEAAAKEKDADQDLTPKVAWGQSGVHTLLDNEYAVSPEPSPTPARAELGQPTGTGTKPAVPTSTKKEPPKLPISSGWAPSGWSFDSNSKDKDVNLTALGKGEAGISATALALLGEQLREERKRTAAAEERNAALEAELREMRDKLLAAQDKAVAILEREAERAERARLAGNF